MQKQGIKSPCDNKTAYVEFGHRQTARWVPGLWKNGDFKYIPGAKTGMKLTNKVIPGFFMLRDGVEESAGQFAADAGKILARIFR